MIPKDVPEPSSPAPTPLDAFLQARVRAGSLVGAVALLATKDSVLHVSVAGCANEAAQLPMLPDSIVRIHSMSKAITSVAALTLLERGLCTLDTEVADVLPNFSQLCRRHWFGARRRAPITLSHLLTHTSGLAYPNPKGARNERELAHALGAAGESDAFPLSEWAERLAHARLAHAPGARFTYGVSTDLLGRIIEVLSGSTLDRYVQQHVTEPLGMHDTGFGVPAEKHDRVSRFYYREGDGHRAAKSTVYTQPAFLSGGGGLFSSANDYLRFCRMLLGEGALDGVRVLSAPLVRSFARCALTGRLTRARIEAGHGLGPGIGHGLVGRVVTDPGRSHFGERGTFGWDGMGGGTFFVDPKRDFAAVFITQILPWQADLHPAFRRAAYATHTLVRG